MTNKAKLEYYEAAINCIETYANHDDIQGVKDAFESLRDYLAGKGK